MSPLNVATKIVALVLLLGWGTALADNLYVFVFKNGTAQPGISIKVGPYENKTDEYGLANFEVPAGDYEVDYFHNGKLFALTEIDLLKDQQSQIFLNLSHEGAEVDLDLPLAAYDQSFDAADIKQQSGPKGTLKFTLIDSKTGQPIKGAKLFFKGYAVEARADERGVASVQLSQGHYDVSVVHPKYVMRVVKDVDVKADASTEQKVKLVRADIVMQEFVVTAPAVEGSLASTLTAMKESSVIGEALSSEEFTKSGDTTAADALKRVTGITIVDGKYVYVRGLGERYSVVLLNDLHVPSPEPTKRVVPLDIFPSGVIQSMTIQKTYGVDLPGTFAGGDVLIVSKDIPEEDNYVSLSVSTTYDHATGDSVYFNEDNAKGLPADIIDKSASFRELQLGYPSLGVPGYTQEELHAINSEIANYRSYDLQTKTLPLGYKAAIDVGQSFKTSRGLKWGVVGTLYTSSNPDSLDGTEYSTTYDIPTGVLSAGERSDYQKTTVSEKQGGLLSLGIDNQRGQKVKYTFLSLDDKENTTIYNEVDGGPAGPGIDDEQRTYYEYLERTITAHQLSGEHHLEWGGSNDLWDDIEINWDLEKAKATRLEPGTVDYVYEKTSDTTDFTLNKKIWFLYSNLNDEVDNYRLDIKLPYKHNNRDNYTAFGYFYYYKSRTLDNRRFKAEHGLGTDVFEDIDSVFTQENVDNGDLVLTSNYRPDDAYTATQDVNAFYVNQLLSVREDLDVMVGLRQESSNQQLVDSQTGVPYDPLITDDTLVSLSVNYSIDEEHKIRLGLANTLSRPDFREFSPNRYKDPITGDIIFGNPDLDYTTIKNFDLKYEWYISYDEILSFGLFKKEFSNPVETIVNQDPDSQSGNKIISYRNAMGASSRGFEISFRKKLGFLSKSLSNIFVAWNYAYIDSNIQLDRNSDDVMIKELSTTDRPMQGQSPYVINVNMGYDNINTGRSVVLAYNEFGKRITALGSYGAPDYYEYPFRKLDFIVKWRLNDTYDEQVKKIGYNVGLKVGNILDSKKETRQGGLVVETYKPGRTFNLSFSVKY